MLTGLFFAVSGYLLGSILFASIISKLFHKDIISKSPDKNYGTANAFRYGGYFQSLKAERLLRSRSALLRVCGPTGLPY